MEGRERRIKRFHLKRITREMVAGMEGEWTKGWTKGWREGWSEGLREGGREGGREPEMEELLEGMIEAQVMEGDGEVRDMKEVMEAGGMHGGQLLGAMEGWRQGWLEAGIEEGMEGSGMRRGWMEGWMEGRRQGLMEAGTEGGMEAGMLEGGMGKGWREGWREGWKDGYKLRWMNSKEEGRDGGMGGLEGRISEREGGRDGGMGWREGWKAGFRNGSKEGWLKGGIVEMMDGGKKELEDFQLNIDKLETEMELIDFIKEIIYHLPFKTFSSNGRYLECTLDNVKISLNYVEVFLLTRTFRVQSEEDRQRVFNDLVSLARLVMNFIREVARSSGKKFPRLEGYNFCSKWIKIIDSLADIRSLCEKRESDWEKRRQSMSNVVDAVKNPLYDVNNILPKLELSDITPDLESCLKKEELLLIKAFPALGELGESSEMVNFLLEETDQLQKAIKKICKLCKGSSLAVLLIGSLLSFKQPDQYTWRHVLKGLAEIIECEGYVVSEDIDGIEDNEDSEDNDDSDYLRLIVAYCIDDLSSHLRWCFCYSACYLIGSEIPATRLIEIWIADGIVKPEKGETLEDTANNYLEEFVQRSLVWVSRRSSSGRIKYFQIPRVIHKFSLERVNLFFHVNPTEKIEEIDSEARVVIFPGNNNQYGEVKFQYLRCFIASDLDIDILGTCPYLKVLELRNSTIRDTILLKLYYLKHLGLRGSSISTLPKDIENMKYLQTLDVRDTRVETLPKSLWNILTLRHVYTNPMSQIQGPPPTANLPNLQTLKTVVVPESWLETFPYSMTNLRKLALSNMDNPTRKYNLDWFSISKMLGLVDNLLSMTIIGNIVPMEFVDTRAFPNLETVKSIRLQGKWTQFKLSIENIKFSPNLTKLTLTKSGLKEDPMPTLERLQALKYLSLKDGAYMGKKMVCSANGFPQLDFLELSELKNLEIWEANPMAMPQLSKLHVIKCCKLKNLPDLEHVSDKYIVN